MGSVLSQYPPFAQSQTPKPISRFHAIVVDKVNEYELLRGASEGDTRTSASTTSDPDNTGDGEVDTAGRCSIWSWPTALVEVPVDDLTQVAVVSWRWDGDKQGRGSRNIASAIRYAKTLGIRYLFIDLVSVDQKLSGDDLLRQVIAFSTLFKTIPVIAAYDEIGEEFRSVTRRPWILNELRLFRYNPTKIIYVGHNGQGTKWKPELAEMFDPGLEILYAVKPSTVMGELKKFEFGDVLERTWNSSFTYSIFGVLCGEIGMTSISDFKFIMPAYERVFTTMEEQKWSRNDYLLTALILSAFCSGDKGRNQWIELASIKLDRYTRERKRASPNWVDLHISLIGVHIATLVDYQSEHSDRFSIQETLPNAERVIFKAVGLASEYSKNMKERRKSLALNRQTVAPLPQVEVVSISLQHE
jgi:hypothetical protein